MSNWVRTVSINCPASIEGFVRSFNLIWNIHRLHEGKVPSKALQRWRSARLVKLNEFDRQILSLPLPEDLKEECLGAFTMLLSSHLQGFSRDLYSECVEYIVKYLPDNIRIVFDIQCSTKIDLDIGNPSFSAINNDFLRFGISIKDGLKDTASNTDIGLHIERLQKWRNYCAHNNRNKPTKAGPFNQTEIFKWLASCNDLAEAMDAIMSNFFSKLGIQAW